MPVELSLKVRVVPKHVSMTSQDQAYFGIVLRASEVLLPKAVINPNRKVQPPADFLLINISVLISVANTEKTAIVKKLRNHERQKQ